MKKLKYLGLAICYKAGNEYRVYGEVTTLLDKQTLLDYAEEDAKILKRKTFVKKVYYYIKD